MGVTIESKNCSIDLGYIGFNNLRTKVAELTAQDIYEHYKKLDDNESIILTGERRKKFFKEYDAEIKRLSEKYGGEKNHILNFLYASDCDGEMDVEHCKAIYEVVKDYDDNFCYGYRGRKDCAMFKDFKEILKDCIESNTPMSWC